MTYDFTSYTALYLVAALCCAAAVPLAWRRRSAPGGLWLLCILLAVVELALADAMEISVLEVAGHVLWSKIAYFGATTVGVFLLLFAVEFAGTGRLLTRKRIAGLFVVPALSIVAVFTNDWHHLIWTRFSFDAPGHNILTYHHGLLYWVITVYGFAVVAVATAVLIDFAVRNKGLYRRQSFGIVIATLIPWVAIIAYDFLPGAWPGLDPGVFLALTGILLTFGLVRFKLLDLIPVARDALIERMVEGLLVVDEVGRIVDVNPAARRLLHIGDGSLIGTAVEDLLPSWPGLVSRLASATPVDEEFVLASPEGRTLSVSVSLLTDKHGGRTGSLCILRDITMQKLAEEALSKSNQDLQSRLSEIESLHTELREQAVRDPLTQLFNRRYLTLTLEREFSRAARESYPVSLVMLDVDHFKQVNDTCGHATGDAVLQRLASQLREQTRPGDLIYRYGGEEFLVVLPFASADDAALRAEQWRSSFEEASPAWVDHKLAPTLSLGVATYPPNDATVASVVAAADSAVYAAKREGRNRVVVAEIR
ncbi:MAG: diguanylate cyclase [Coriobacteriia bacterium]|nr:diguanylate cyclase [Coriobacteriia bacterium]